MTEIIKDLIGILTLIAGFVGGLWVYTKFVIERGLLPPVQFDIECQFLNEVDDKRGVEILIHLKNLGSSTLVARNIRQDIRYTSSIHSKFELFTEGTLAGRLKFPGSLTADLDNTSDELLAQNHPAEPSAQAQKKQRGFAIMSYDTFVQPGVDQIYTFVTAIPADTEAVLTWCSFEYAQRPTPLQSFILKLSRSIGLIQYSLEHIQEPHKFERAFAIPQENRTRN